MARYNDAQLYRLWIENKKNKAKVSRITGVPVRTLFNVIKRHEKFLEKNPQKKPLKINAVQREAIEQNIDTSIIDGQKLKGVSTLYGEEGQVRMQWVKTQPDLERQLEILSEACNALKENVKPQKPRKNKPKCLNDLLSCYIISDYHFGMLAWHEEGGDDWDIAIAERTLLNWFKAAIESSPKSHTGLFCQLGDFLHYDGLDAVTPTNKHPLDADSRFPKIVNATIRIFRTVVEMLLDKHEHVHIVMAEGNHDLASSVWLRALFAEKYKDEPRITIDNTHIPYYAYGWGNTSLFFHHGHKKKVSAVSELFAAQFRELFGSTKYSYAHTGHLHHTDVKENSLMIVEQHQTLAANDAHGARGGWRSQRGAVVITYSKKYGEVSRSTIKPEMVE